jgi:hypothetical protein
MRLPEHLWMAVERWRKRQTDKPTKPEAIRRLLAFALALDPKLDGEKDD